MNQPKTYCIALQNHQTSLRLLSECIESAKKFDWAIETFWGIDGTLISQDTWNFHRIPPPVSKKFRQWPAMQGCFLSNFLLWEKCVELQQPIIILEHDAVIIKPLIELYEAYDVVKLQKPISRIKETVQTGKWNFGTHGYLVHPSGAKKLVDWVRNNFPHNPDILIGDKIVHYKNLDDDYVIVNHTAVSTTQR